MERIDVVIVGGGLAGLSCAYGLADSGLTVLVLERGDFSGSKNVTGGRIYLEPVRRLLPDLWDEAPLERHVVRERLTLLGRTNSTSIDHYSDRRDQRPYPSYTILRARFDRWLSEKVAERGGFVIPQKRVDDLLMDGKRVVGVTAGDEEIPARVVVAADGVLSFLAERAGLRRDFEPEDLAVGYKEIIHLGDRKIEDRFNLEPGQGAAQLFVGAITGGMMGGGFIYTNKETISLGMVLGLAPLTRLQNGIEAYRLLDAFKERPEIRRLVEGGETVEYSAHLIPEGGIRRLAGLVRDGMLVVGDAAGFGLNMLVTVRGMEYAMISGVLAAETIKRAAQSNDFSASTLSHYEYLLKRSVIIRDMETFRRSAEILKNPRLFSLYPQSVCDLLEKVMEIDEKPKERLSSTVFKELRRNILTLRGIKDLWSLRGI
ncbi:MAG: FAD-dependent oxidoreductase [Deltaproteobacteria bacterium]|nr:FAD-dependent oxidoreductase [Deltaproteobacteria bacterium]MBW2123191.1 FAD-dependent oxidoreductase [Deltaproteobacteria bacterium]